MAGGPGEDILVCKIVVQEARDLSNKVASLTGVTHQSPQVLLIKDGKCVWNASHHDITAQKLASMVSE